jgi:hypothetical protein
MSCYVVGRGFRACCLSLRVRDARSNTNQVHSMTFAQRRNRLTTHFSERIPVVKRCTTVQRSFKICMHVTTNNLGAFKKELNCKQKVIVPQNFPSMRLWVLIEIQIIIVFSRVMTRCRFVECYKPSVEYIHAGPGRPKRHHETAKTLVRL